jgi:hypothetical protein
VGGDEVEIRDEVREAGNQSPLKRVARGKLGCRQALAQDSTASQATLSDVRDERICRETLQRCDAGSQWRLHLITKRSRRGGEREYRATVWLVAAQRLEHHGTSSIAAHLEHQSPARRASRD